MKNYLRLESFGGAPARLVFVGADGQAVLVENVEIQQSKITKGDPEIEVSALITLKSTSRGEVPSFKPKPKK